MTEKIDKTNKYENYQFTAYIGQNLSDIGLLKEYNYAINIIIKDLKATKTRVDAVAHPLLYMMRHSLELGYKSNYKHLVKYSFRETSKNLFNCHDLEKLHNEFKQHFDLIKINLNLDLTIIEEFSKYFDLTTGLISHLGSKESSSFRYTKNRKEERIFNSNEIKNIGDIKELYDKALIMLIHTLDVISDLKKTK